MDSERYTVVALPHSVRDDADFHVSLFVSPRLVPSHDGEPLSQATIFPKWASHLLDARIQLHDHAGEIDCEPLLAPVESPVWPQLFGPDTPVAGRAVPDWSNRHWRSFDTRNVDMVAKGLHNVTMYADPTAPPGPSSHPLAKAMMVMARRYSRQTDSTTGQGGVYDESLMTAAMDEIVEHMPLEEWPQREIDLDATRDPTTLVEGMAIELHRARRFYERPESQGEYRERPDPDTTSPPLPSPEPEFHERVAMVGDHPALLRRLGLVVDLRADVERLRTARFLTGRIIVEVDDSACITTRVPCRDTRDGAFVTVPAGDDWHDGALLLGDEDRFRVLDTDTDGSAIKTERFLWTMPRLAAVEANGDDADTAAPALRSSGFTMARIGQALTVKQRLARQQALQAELATNKVSQLHTEDVTRGMRIEVFDDTTGRWATLHARLTDVAVHGHGKVLDDLAEEGFVQGTAASETSGVQDSPVHVHEAMFGWEGWSLSAPRPGKRIRKATPEEVEDTGETEIVEDTPEDPMGHEAPPHPISITTEVAEGTLPRLRYGRSYAFRAWAVDLAGNSRPHRLDPAPIAPAEAITNLLGGAADPSPARRVAEAGGAWSNALRTITHATLEERTVATPAEPARVELPERLTELLAPRLRAHRIEVTDPGGVESGRRATRRALVEAATAAAVADPDEPIVAETAVVDVDRIARLAAGHVSALLDDDLPGVDLVEVAVESLSTVTRLRPFLRWHPVEPPAVVPRDRFTEGESVRVLVVRSGVTQDPDTLEVSVAAPADYAASVPAERRYAATSQRHLAPPKTTQVTAELHGEFDPGIGTTAADAQQVLGWAIAEDGSFSDMDRADLDNPPDRIDQPGIRLEHSAETPQAELKSLPLGPGEAPAPGQYVVHDTDDLAIPYLPDPMAVGVSFVFPEAGRGRSIPFPFGVEGFTARHGGQWPRIDPYRLVLAGSEELDAEVDGRVVTFSLPPGDLQRARLATSLRADDLDLLGPWRSLAPSVRNDPDVVEAAKDGWLWGLTPSQDLLFVHAVPRPVEAPRPTVLAPVRQRGDTSVVLFGGVDVHGPSTDSLVAEATWTDVDDGLALDQWQQRPMSAVAFQTPIDPGEDMAVLWNVDGAVNWPGLPGLRTHRAEHLFGDTLHRHVTYRFRAKTRFREYFHPSLLAPEHPDDDGQSTISAAVEVDVPSSAPPAAPVVHSVIPLFRWDLGEEPEQPMARRHVRRAGVRIYLERPWFSSGEGELLAVLLSPPPGGDEFGPRGDGDQGFPFVSKVGQDPVWISTPIARRPMNLLQLDNLLHATGLDDREVAGRPVAPARVLPLTTIKGAPQVQAVGYRPQYSTERRKWYVDVALDAGMTFWSFVRLAVARYQPSSVDGCHLSAPVRCDHVQLPPERTVSVSRTDESHVRVVVSGTVGMRSVPATTAAPTPAMLVERIAANRTVVARLQRRDPLLPTDLGWETVATEQLRIRGTGANTAEAAWVGELGAGEDVFLRRPVDPPSAPVHTGDDDEVVGDWRIMVEEWERLPGDVLAPREAGPLARNRPRWEQRLVFADEVLL